MSLATESKTNPPAKKPLPGRDYPWYSPRFWHGMCLGDWLKLASQNRWKMHPARWGMAATTTMFTAGNSLLRPAQQVIHGRAIERTEITRPPVFIIGHWRSGTTYLHELLMRDERYATPTSFQCFQPHHMLLTEWVVTRLFGWVMPGKRPMDNVSLDWNSPQEDEFALLALGAATPYRRMAFPKNGPVDLDYLDMQGLSDDELARWKSALLWFVKLMTYHTGRQVLLKSPPHTGRIKVLAELFPGAKFIHLTRDPYALYPSTIKLWRALHYAQGFQLSEGDDLEEYVFTGMERMYAGYEAQRPAIADADIIDLRYEELVANPIEELARIYEALDLGDFDVVRPQLADYADRQRSYQPNRHRLDVATREAVANRWAFYFEKYGYAV